MAENIILIGPSKAGKTTISEILGEQLKRPVVALDDLRWEYYAEVGYDAEEAQRIRTKKGLMGIVAYWKRFDLHAVQRVLADYPQDTVIAFGAGHSYYEDAESLAQAKSALAGQHVVLLLPAPGIDEALSMLEARLAEEDPSLVGGAIGDFNRRFLEYYANPTLATLTIYTQNQTPQQTCTAIIEQLGL